MIRPIMSRARATSWSSYQLALRRRRLQEGCASILSAKTCLRLSVGSTEQRLAPLILAILSPQALSSKGGLGLFLKLALCFYPYSFSVNCASMRDTYYII